MSWGSADHSHRGEYAEERHDHREIDEVRWDLERRMDDRDDELRSRISDVSRDTNSSREEIWTALDEVQSTVDSLEKRQKRYDDQVAEAVANAVQALELRIIALEGGSHE
jgi:chromosome segregation ATPase